jgi:hypothetical protein
MHRLHYVWLPWMLAMALCEAASALAADANRIEIAADSHRERVSQFLQRDDVRRELAARGIDPGKVQAKVNALDRRELDRLAREIDQAALNGQPVVPIFAVGLFAFIVLLVTDLLGVTRIFPFIRH